VNAPSTVGGRVKNRILGFQGPHADLDQAGSAAGSLAPRPGILHVEALDTWRVDIWYDLRVRAYRMRGSPERSMPAVTWEAIHGR